MNGLEIRRVVALLTSDFTATKRRGYNCSRLVLLRRCQRNMVCDFLSLDVCGFAVPPFVVDGRAEMPLELIAERRRFFCAYKNGK